MSWKLGERWQMAHPIGDKDFYSRPVPYRWWLWGAEVGDPLRNGLAYSAEDYDAGKIPGLLDSHPDLRLIDDPKIGRVWVCFGCANPLPARFEAFAVKAEVTSR